MGSPTPPIECWNLGDTGVGANTYDAEAVRSWARGILAALTGDDYETRFIVGFLSGLLTESNKNIALVVANGRLIEMQSGHAPLQMTVSSRRKRRGWRSPKKVAGPSPAREDATSPAESGTHSQNNACPQTDTGGIGSRGQSRPPDETGGVLPTSEDAPGSVASPCTECGGEVVDLECGSCGAVMPRGFGTCPIH